MIAEYKERMECDMEKTGLVLEGGGMRGIYTAGVLDVFMEHGIAFDGVIGVSAGAVHGCSFVSKQHGRSIRYYKKYCKDKRFMSIWSLLTTGDIVGEKFCYHDLPEVLDPYDYDTYNQSKTEFYTTSTNLATGKAEYLQIKDMKKEIDLIRASASMPYVSRIVKWNDKELLDGGCSDSVPVKAFQNMGFGKNVVVLTRHDGYVKLPENTKMAGIMYRKYPEFVKTLKNRHTMYNRTMREIKEMEKNGEIFVIRPSEKLTIGRMEHHVEKVQEVYEIGRRDAGNQIAALKIWMNKSENSI